MSSSLLTKSLSALTSEPWPTGTGKGTGSLSPTSSSLSTESTTNLSSKARLIGSSSLSTELTTALSSGFLSLTDYLVAPQPTGTCEETGSTSSKSSSSLIGGLDASPSILLLETGSLLDPHCKGNLAPLLFLLVSSWCNWSRNLTTNSHSSPLPPVAGWCDLMRRRLFSPRGGLVQYGIKASSYILAQCFLALLLVVACRHDGGFRRLFDLLLQHLFLPPCLAQFLVVGWGIPTPLVLMPPCPLRCGQLGDWRPLPVHRISCYCGVPLPAIMILKLSFARALTVVDLCAARTCWG
jgi:hypothetical protein